jgi:hypothetical protein
VLPGAVSLPAFFLANCRPAGAHGKHSPSPWVLLIFEFSILDFRVARISVFEVRGFPTTFAHGPFAGTCRVR